MLIPTTTKPSDSPRINREPVEARVPSGTDQYLEAGEPSLNEIDFKFLLVDQSRLDALAAGEIEWADAVPLIVQVDVSVWFDRFSKGTYQITSAYQERTIDPDNFYSLVIKSGGSINTTKYSNKRVDSLIDRAATTTDATRRKGLYTQLRAIVQDEAPIIFVHYETLNYLMQKKVVGSTVSPVLELNIAQVGFTK